MHKVAGPHEIVVLSHGKKRELLICCVFVIACGKEELPILIYTMIGRQQMIGENMVADSIAVAWLCAFFLSPCNSVFGHRQLTLVLLPFLTLHQPGMPTPTPTPRDIVYVFRQLASSRPDPEAACFHAFDTIACMLVYENAEDYTVSKTRARSVASQLRNA